MLAEDGVACRNARLKRSSDITFSISRRAVLVNSALFASIARDEGASEFVCTVGYSPKTRAVGTRPSGPSVSFIVLTDRARISPGSEVG